MKFVLFVEGETERKALPHFFKRWLDKKLNHPCGIKPVKFDGCNDLIKEAPKKAALQLKNKDTIAVVALLDLYGPDYPVEKKTLVERYEWAKQDLEKKVNKKEFHVFFAVHELEAWLLSDPSIFPENVRKAFPGKISQPEEINFNEPPGKLLKRLYKQKIQENYKKAAYGNELFLKLDPEIAYNKCPYLKKLLDTMLELAKAKLN